MKKHLTVDDLRKLLEEYSRNDMGGDVPVVVVVGGEEYPVVGAQTYDGVFCNMEVGLAFADGYAERIGEAVYVKV